ncbi:MAG: sigma-70 family RNA polymerase sigma factor [Kofleriaceae bacterium]
MKQAANIDTDLVRAALGADVKAFGRLVERHHGAVVAVAFAITRDLGLAEDIAQETFCAAWTGLGTLRDPSAVRAWLCNIARNQSRNALRSRRREVSDEPPPLADARPTPDQAALDTERKRAVAAALARIPDVYREPLVLYYWHERSIEEVARSLAISEPAAQKRLSRGRAFLKDDLQGDLELVGVARRSATAAAAAIVAVCATRKVASAGVATTATSGVIPTGGAVIAIALVTLVVVGVAVLWTLSGRSRSTQDGAADIDSLSLAPHVAATGRSSTAAPVLPVTDASTSGSSNPEDSEPRGSFGSPSEYAITPTAPGHVAINLSGGASSVTFFEPPGPPPSLERHVSGRVVDAAGRPIPNATVVIAEELRARFGSLLGNHGAITADDGSFSVAVRGDSAMQAVALHPQAGWSPRVSVPAGKADAELQLRVPTPGSLSVMVRRGNEPIEADLEIKPLDDVVFEMRLRSDATGAISLPLLPPGRYRVRALAARMFLGPTMPVVDREIRINSGKSTSIAIELPVGALVVARIKPPTGVQLMTVEFFLVPGTGSFTLESIKQRKPHGALYGGQDVDDVDAQFDDVAPGTYTICVDSRLKDGGRLPLACGELEVSATKPVNSIELELRR